MKLIFKGKVAVVTGGSGGIGLDVSKKLAKLKIKVLILDINKPKIIKNKFIYFEQVDLSNENEINQAEKLAKYIIKRRSLKKINTNFEFINVLRDSGVNFRSKKIHFATKAFQALRIEVNGELDALESFLLQSADLLNEGGRLVVMSYHSLEDRMVKKYLKLSN